MRTRLSLVVAGLATSTLIGSAQFSDVHLVTVPVTITDQSGTSVTPELTAANFVLKEDGKDQRIATVSAGPGAVSVTVVLDTKEMAQTPHRLGERAVEHLAARLTPQDEISLVMVREGPHFTAAVPWTRGGQFPKFDWTTWRTLPFSDLLNGVRTALFQMDTARNARRAVIAVTSMDEVASAWALAKFVLTQPQSETAIYAFWTQDIATRTTPPSDTGSSVSTGRMVTFDDLLREGGGRTFPVRSTDEADRGAERFLEELRQQHVIRYVPAKPLDGTYRKLKIELKGTKNLKIRHRLGYLAEPPRR